MKVIFACAGTGGHINPAIAIANIILKNKPNSEMLFIGTKIGIENELVTKAGFKIKHIRNGKILRKITFKNVKNIYNSYKGIGDAKKIIKAFSPDVIIGTGGYICFPVMIAAKKLKIPYILHEANAFPGMAVKVLARKASKVMLGFEEAKNRLKYKGNLVYTGIPGKFTKNSIDELDKTKCMKDFNLENINKKIVFVSGGSQGAKKINEVIIDVIEKYLPKDFFTIIVTGEKNYDDVKQKVANFELEKGINLDEYLKVVKFIYDMDKIYKVSDLCITRGGALTITELSLAGKSAIIIPLPYATENHQLYNAKVLEKVNAAKIIEEKDLLVETLYLKIEEMLESKKLSLMSRNARSIVNNNVEKLIYRCIEDALQK